jgi:hypothetical protein
MLPLFSWLVSFYFLSGFVWDVSFPPRLNVSPGHVFFGALWLFFLFLPFFRRVKIGSFLELERELEKTRADLRDFKTEIRSSLTLISTNVNTIGNLSNQITVNVPGAADLAEIKKRLDDLAQPGTREEAKEIRSELAAIDGEDRIMALARTRIRLEYLLREILGKRTTIPEEARGGVKFMALSQLVRLFLERYPHHRSLEEPLRYLIQVANAAVHAQRLSEAQADEALDIGARMLAILTDVRNSAQ